MYSSEPAYGVIAVMLLIGLALLSASIYMGIKYKLYKQTAIIVGLSILAIINTILYIPALIMLIGFIIYCRVKNKEIKNKDADYVKIYTEKSNEKLIKAILIVQIVYILLSLLPLWSYEQFYLSANTVIFGGAAIDEILKNYSREYAPFSIYENIYYIIPIYIIPAISAILMAFLKGNKKKHFVISLILVYISFWGFWIIDNLVSVWERFRILRHTPIYTIKCMLVLVGIVLSIIGIITTKYRKE